MHRTTINISDPVFREAKMKALREDVTVSEVIRSLLERWVAGDIQLNPDEQAHQRRVALARAARGMWSDRDPDDYLSTSRIGLKARDEELARARMDA